LPVYVESGEVGGAIMLGPRVEQGEGFAMQPVRAPAGRDVGTVAPDGADLLASDGLPHALAVGNGAAGKKKLAAGGVDVGERRRLADHFAADAARDREGPQDDDGKDKLITLV